MTADRYIDSYYQMGAFIEKQMIFYHSNWELKLLKITDNQNLDI